MTANQVIVNPRTGEPVTAGQAFAAWLEANEPDLFQALLKEAAAHGAVAAASAPGGQLGDWSDVLSSIGSGISDAASSVGTWLTSSQGLQSLSSLANVYLQNQTAQSVTQMQLSRAQAGLPPAPVTYTTNTAGQAVPVYTGSQVPNYIAPYAGQAVTLPSGQTAYPLAAPALSALAPSSALTAYLPWILAGGGLLLLTVLLSSRRE